MIGKCTTPKGHQVIDCDTCADNTQVLVLDRTHVTRYALKSPENPVSVYEHDLPTPTKVRALKYEKDGSLCVLPEKSCDSEGNYFVRIVNLIHGYVILRFHHENHPVNQIVSLSNDQGLITGSINCVKFWKCNFPKNMKAPTVLIPAEIELNLADSAIKNMTEYYLNMDRLETDFSLTRLTYSTDRHYFYRTQFYTLDRVTDGYTHAFNFKTESPVDKCVVSGDGAFLLLHLAKKSVLIISTEDGEPVSPALSSSCLGYSRTVSAEESTSVQCHPQTEEA